MIVGSHFLAQDKLNSVAKKVETISISQRRFEKLCYKKEHGIKGELLVLPDKIYLNCLVKMLK